MSGLESVADAGPKIETPREETSYGKRGSSPTDSYDFSKTIFSRKAADFNKTPKLITATSGPVQHPKGLARNISSKTVPQTTTSPYQSWLSQLGNSFEISCLTTFGFHHEIMVGVFEQKRHQNHYVLIRSVSRGSS